MTFILRSVLCMLMVTITVVHLSAQQWKLDKDNLPKVSITGTSTLSDWEVVCEGVTGMPDQLDFDSSKPSQIIDFGFKVPVETMDGGRGASMNDKIKTAFESTTNPYVTYSQTEPAKVTRSAGSDEFKISSTGTLSMAGLDKSITVECLAVITDGVLVISGFKDLKFSEYKMAPPTAMFGQIKTHDDIVVNYEFRYLKQ